MGALGWKPHACTRIGARELLAAEVLALRCAGRSPREASSTVPRIGGPTLCAQPPSARAMTRRA
eukprot:8122828-Alexandrium_andersonii.AAC.1